MPKIDHAALQVPDLPELEAAYWRSRSHFRALIGRIFEETWKVADPLPMLRFLQLVQRPSWAIAHGHGGPDVRMMVGALVTTLAEAQARLILHSPHEKLEEPDAIRFVWHAGGRRRLTWYYKAAALPGRLALDRDGYSGSSELAALPRERLAAVTQEEAERFHAGLLSRYVAAGVSRHRQDETAPAPAPGFVLVPLQLPNDSVIPQKLFEAPYLDGMRTAIASLAGAGHRVVVKRHPLCKDPAVAALLEALPAGVEVTRASVFRLLPACRAVVTLNSGVGFEALVHLKPVVAIGRADYAMVAQALPDPAGAGAAVEAAVAGFAPRRVMRFLTLALSQYQFDPDDADAVRRQAIRALCWHYLETAAR